MYIRQAQRSDAQRFAEIEVFNYRINFYPIFKNDRYYFKELNVASAADEYISNTELLKNTFVYDDGAVKGFIRLEKDEIKKLFVEPVLQGQSIGASLLEYAVQNKGAAFLWALEKNTRALKFYEDHGFRKTGERKPEEETDEYLIRLAR